MTKRNLTLMFCGSFHRSGNMLNVEFWYIMTNIVRSNSELYFSLAMLDVQNILGVSRYKT